MLEESVSSCFQPLRFRVNVCIIRYLGCVLKILSNNAIFVKPLEELHASLGPCRVYCIENDQ